MQSVNILDYEGKIIKSYNPLDKPQKIFISEYIIKTVLENAYKDYICVSIDNENVKIMTEEQYIKYGKECKKKYKREKKKKEVDEIKKNNARNEIDLNDPTNIKIVDFNNNILQTITHKFYKSTYILYKPLIQNQYPNLFDVKIDDNTIKLMNEEQFKNHKKKIKSIYNKEYREENWEKLIEYDKKYREEHKKK